MSFEEQKRLHSCKHCGNFECSKYKIYREIDRYLAMLGGDSLADDLKSLVGSECQVFVYNLDQFEKKSDSVFIEISKNIVGKYKQ